MKKGIKSLDEALEYVAVHECDEMIEACKAGGIEASHPPGWYGVSTDDESVIAYFSTPRAAFEYRLFLVNQILNGPDNDTQSDA